MVPTPEQIQVAAYHRWQRGGWQHGCHHEDWCIAERDLQFARDYEVVASYPLDGPARQLLGRRDERVCRFCEQAEPHVAFDGLAPSVPAALGNAVLYSLDECAECRALFAEAIEPELVAFGRSCREGEPGSISIGAFKGLVKVALAIMPARELNYYSGAVDWVLNPDHDLDGLSFADLGCDVYRLGDPPAGGFVALARRRSDEVAGPYLVAFLGTGDVSLVAAVPLGNKDEDLDGEPQPLPRVALPDGLDRGRGRQTRRFVPVAAERPRRFGLVMAGSSPR